MALNTLKNVAEFYGSLPDVEEYAVEQGLCPKCGAKLEILPESSGEERPYCTKQCGFMGEAI